MYNTQYFLVIAVLGLNAVAGELPEFIQKCSKSDPILNECIIKSSNVALPILFKGVPSINIARIIPFQLPEMDLKVTDNLRYILSDGLSTTDIETAKISYADINFQNKTLKLNFYLPVSEWDTAFLASGNILGKRIQEQGRLKLTFYELQFNYTGQFEIKDIDGQDYMQFTSGDAITMSKSFDMLHFNQNSVGNKISDAQQKEFLKISKAIILPVREQVKKIGSGLVASILNIVLKLEPESVVFDP